MKASDCFVQCLVNEKIPALIGVPGEENADLMMSLEGAGIPFVLTRHEQGAAFAAGVYGRLTGEPLGCVATLGPGATNLITGVADTNMDRAPMLVITGQGSTDRHHKESHQIMDVVSMYEPVTKWATSISNPDTIPEIIRKAVRTARSEKPGAVLIELPEDVAKRQTSAAPLDVFRFRRPEPDALSVESAADAIHSAKHPVILAGNGAIRSRASRQLRTFASATGIGVISTFMGKGAIDRDDEHCLFTVGLQDRDLLGCILSDADCVITIGYDLVEYPPRLWRGGTPKTVVHVDFVPAEIDRDYNPPVELVGDVAASLQALTRAMGTRRDTPFVLPEQRKVRAAMIEEFDAYANDDQRGRIRPQKMLHDIRAALGPHDVLLSGVGAHKMWIGRQYSCHEPNTCIIPNGFCSMGLPLPGLIGARLAFPGSDPKVVALCGDGDFLMNVQEMETIARLGLDVVCVVWEDRSYGLIEWKQENEFGTHTDLSFSNPHWVGLAESFGWRGETVCDSGEFAPALARALQHPGPALLAAEVDYRENTLLTERLGQITCRI